MSTVKRFVLGGLVAICALPVTYLGFRALARWRQGYPWQEMDWHQRGSTSIGDFLAASDIGKRSITAQDGRLCTEYYSYKDGLPVKMVCPK
jgi:hypothetical protein